MIRSVCAMLAASALVPAAAAASTVTGIGFTGLAAPGANGEVHLYETEELVQTSFAGEPVQVGLALGRYQGAYYVTHFHVSWSDDSFVLPFTTQWDGDGIPNEDEFDGDFISRVNLGPTGGSIVIRPTDAFVGRYDAAFEFSLNFAYAPPPPPEGSFADYPVSGGGRIGAYLTDISRPDIGGYDAYSVLNFTVSSATVQAVPEPSAWALVILGFGGLGLAMRRRRPVAA